MAFTTIYYIDFFHVLPNEWIERNGNKHFYYKSRSHNVQKWVGFASVIS